MTLRLPIPALALLGLQLGACAKDDPLAGHWSATELEGAAKPDALTIEMTIDADLEGELRYVLHLYGEDYDYTSALKIDPRDAPAYVISVSASGDLPASQMRCELAGDTLTCTDVSGAGLGDPVFKRD